MVTNWRLCSAVVFLLASLALYVSGCSTIQALIQPPKAEIKSVSITNVSLQGIDLDVNVSVFNPNSTELTVDKIKYNLSIGDSSLFAGDFAQPMKLKPNDTSQVTIPIHLNYQTSRAAIENYIFKSAKTYTFKADLTSGIFTIPIEDKGQLEIKK